MHSTGPFMVLCFRCGIGDVLSSNCCWRLVVVWCGILVGWVRPFPRQAFWLTDYLCYSVRQCIRGTCSPDLSACDLASQPGMDRAMQCLSVVVCCLVYMGSTNPDVGSTPVAPVVELWWFCGAAID